MAQFHTHRAFTTLAEAGFTERRAQALLDVGREGCGALVNKNPLDARIEWSELHLTPRFGAMVAAGVAILAALELLSR